MVVWHWFCEKGYGSNCILVFGLNLRLLCCVWLISMLAGSLGYIPFSYRSLQSNIRMQRNLLTTQLSRTTRIKDIVEISGDGAVPGQKYAFQDELTRHSLSRTLGLLSVDGETLDSSKLFPHCSVRPSIFGPTINRYIIANPQQFFKDKLLIERFGLDLMKIDEEFLASGEQLSVLTKYLPVVYIANVHSDFGWLGFQLNLQSVGETVEDLFPSLKVIRNQPLYPGGVKQQGSAWYMLHRRKDFPENRAFKKLPISQVINYPAFNNDAFAIFYSPAVAYANELCMGGDAQPEEFKFFSWSTIWGLEQLENEVKDRKWIVVEGPAEILFTQDPKGEEPPLYRRILCSLPKKKRT